MINDDERREVSRLLREEFGQGQCHWPDLFRDMLAEILECNETLDAGPLYDQMAEKLADLIDPTCRNVSGYKDTFECSKCRCKVELITEVCNEHGEPFHVPLVPSYCPNCRARVVSGDE